MAGFHRCVVVGRFLDQKPKEDTQRQAEQPNAETVTDGQTAEVSGLVL